MYIFLVHFYQRLIANKYIVWFLYYCITQNIISIAILPVYATWGIPFSPLSIVGNFIFAPFLSMYIFLSLLIFIGFVFQHAFVWLIILLKKITSFWIGLMYFLETICQVSPIAFIDIAGYWYFLCWGSIVLFFYFNVFEKNVLFSFFMSALLLIVIILIMINVRSSVKNFIIQDWQKTYSVRYINDTTVAVFLLERTRKNLNENELKYTVKPEIIKKFGMINPKILLY